MKKEVSLYDMLEARERRAMTQKRLLDLHHCCLISLTLNIPGPVKVMEGVPEAFEEGCRRIEAALKQAEISILEKHPVYEWTGYEAIYCIQADPMSVKSLMVSIEDSGRLGRLFDIDVIRPDGEKVSREDLGCPPRTCLLCGQPAHACARSRAHSVPELVNEIQHILQEFI